MQTRRGILRQRLQGAAQGIRASARHQAGSGRHRSAGDNQGNFHHATV